MKKLFFNFLVLSIFAVMHCKNALTYFIEHRKVKNFSMTILNPNSSSYWIEYKYVFEATANHTTKKINYKLNVGLIFQNDNKFDCRLTNASELKGYSVDIIKWLENSLNISANFIILNNTLNYTHSLLSGEIDLITCHKDIKSNFEIIELFPTIKSKHLLMYQPTKLNFTKDIFILSFAGSLWLVFFILLVVLAVCLRIATTKYSTLHPKYEPWTWVEITLWAIAAACQQGLSHTPNGFSSCCIFFIGYLTAYLLYTGFAAAITSLLVQHDMYYKLDVNSLNSEKLNLVIFDGSRFATRSLVENFGKTIYVHDLHTMFKYLKNDDTVGLAPEILINQYMAKFLKFEEISTYLTYKISSARYNKGFHIPRNSTWRKIINYQILRMEEKGILRNMLSRNLLPVPIPDLRSGYSSAGPEHVGSAILIWLSGVVASLVFLLAECAFSFYKRNRRTLGL